MCYKSGCHGTERDDRRCCSTIYKKYLNILPIFHLQFYHNVNYTNLSPTIIHLEGSRLCSFLRRSNITEFGFPTIIGSFLAGIFMDPTIAPVPVGKIKIVRLYTDVQLEWVDFLSFQI